MSEFQAAAKQAYANWRASLAAVAATQAALANAKVMATTAAGTPGATSYSESGPTGAQSVDWNGQINSLTATLLAQQKLVDEQYALICKFPYQITTRGF